MRLHRFPPLSGALVLASALVLWACWNTSPSEVESRTFLDPALETVMEENIVYGTGAVRSPEAADVDLLLDLYRPEKPDLPALRPALVVIHGGGFTSGTRQNTTAAALASTYAERGYVAVSIDYRMMGDDPPAEDYAADPSDPRSVAAAAARMDAARAVHWIREHADEYRIDPNRVAVGGYSAGAITALGVGLRDPGPDGADVRAVLSLSGALYDHTDSIVDADDPPPILIHGTEDTSTPIERARAIADRASEVGLIHEFYPLEGVGHGTPEKLGTVVDGTRLSARIANFFYDHLDLDDLTGSSP